jgi:hypothetical protein
MASLTEERRWAATELLRRQREATTPQEKLQFMKDVQRARTDPAFTSQLAAMGEHGRWSSGSPLAAKMALGAGTLAGLVPGLQPLGIASGAALAGLAVPTAMEAYERSQTGLPYGWQAAEAALDLGVPGATLASKLLRGLSTAKGVTPTILGTRTISSGPGKGSRIGDSSGRTLLAGKSSTDQIIGPTGRPTITAHAPDIRHGTDVRGLRADEVLRDIRLDRKSQVADIARHDPGVRNRMAGWQSAQTRGGRQPIERPAPDLLRDIDKYQRGAMGGPFKGLPEQALRFRLLRSLVPRKRGPQGFTQHALDYLKGQDEGKQVLSQAKVVPNILRKTDDPWGGALTRSAAERAEAAKKVADATQVSKTPTATQVVEPSTDVTQAATRVAGDIAAQEPPVLAKNFNLPEGGLKDSVDMLTAPPDAAGKMGRFNSGNIWKTDNNGNKIIDFARTGRLGGFNHAVANEADTLNRTVLTPEMSGKEIVNKIQLSQLRGTGEEGTGVLRPIVKGERSNPLGVAGDELNVRAARTLYAKASKAEKKAAELHLRQDITEELEKVGGNYKDLPAIYQKLVKVNTDGTVSWSTARPNQAMVKEFGLPRNLPARSLVDLVSQKPQAVGGGKRQANLLPVQVMALRLMVDRLDGMSALARQYLRREGFDNYAEAGRILRDHTLGATVNRAIFGGIKGGKPVKGWIHTEKIDSAALEKKLDDMGDWQSNLATILAIMGGSSMFQSRGA